MFLNTAPIFKSCSLFLLLFGSFIFCNLSKDNITTYPHTLKMASECHSTAQTYSSAAVPNLFEMFASHWQTTSAPA
jgi:hypothetical protein